MTGRRDLLLAGSSALAGAGAGALASGTGRAAAKPAPAGSDDGVAITDHGARTDAADNSRAIERAAAQAMAQQRALVVPAGTFRFTTVDLRGNDGTDTRRLLLTGPGTLRSEHPGTALVARADPFYDLVIDGPTFESEPGKGTTLLDGDRFRRLVIAPGTQIRNFDYVIRATDYLQTVRMIGVIVRGGAGAVVRAPAAYDCVFSHNIIEFVTDGFVIDGDGDPALNRCSIDDNLIEGLGGRAIVLGACLGTSICNNYLENNTGGDIRLDAGTAPHKGLKVQGNAIQIAAKGLAAGRFGVVWGQSTALPVRAGGNFCTGNLHDTEGTSALIDMTGDYAAGQLYRGFSLTAASGKPVGRTLYSDGLSQHLTWFDREITLNPHQSEIGFSGPFAPHDAAPVLTFGARSPVQDPGGFDRKMWTRGSVVFNASPTTGGAAAWVCVRAGSPGEWAVVRAEGGR